MSANESNTHGNGNDAWNVSLSSYLPSVENGNDNGRIDNGSISASNRVNINDTSWGGSSNNGLELISDDEDSPDRRQNRYCRDDEGLEVINDGDSPDQRNSNGSNSSAASSLKAKLAADSKEGNLGKIDGKQLQLKKRDPTTTYDTSDCIGESSFFKKDKIVNSASVSRATNTSTTFLPRSTPATGNLEAKRNMAQISRHYSSAGVVSGNARNGTTTSMNTVFASAPIAAAPQMWNSANTIENQPSENQTATVAPFMPTIQENTSRSNPDPSSHVIIEATLVEDPIQAIIVEDTQHFPSEGVDEARRREPQYFENSVHSNEHNNDDQFRNKRIGSEIKQYCKRKGTIGFLILLIMAVTFSTVLTLFITRRNERNSGEPSNSTKNITEMTINSTIDSSDNNQIDFMNKTETTFVPSQSPSQQHNNGTIIDDNVHENLFADHGKECTQIRTTFRKKLLSNFSGSIDSGNCIRCKRFVAIDGENAVIASKGYVHFYHLTPSISTDGKPHNETTANQNNITNREWKISSTLTIEGPTLDRYIPAISGNLAVVGARDDVISWDDDNDNTTVQALLRSGSVYVFELLSDNLDSMDNEGNISSEKKTWRQTAKLIPEDPMSGARFGHSVSVVSNIALSPTNKNTSGSFSDVIVVGAPYDREGEKGSVYIFRRLHWDDESSQGNNGFGGNVLSTGEWFQEAKLAPQDPNLEDYGWDVEVYQKVNDDDGGNNGENSHTDNTTTRSMTTIVAVGDDYYGESNSGTVFLYRYDEYDGTNTNMTSNGENNKEGVITSNNIAGTNAGTWRQWGANMLNFGCYADFGVSIVFNDFDQSLAIGCYADDGYVGSVYYYTFNDNVVGDNVDNMEEEVYIFQQKISPSDGYPDDRFGNYLQIDLDDNLMVVGSAIADDERGKAYVFAREMDEMIGDSRGLWKEIAILTPQERIEESIFGFSIAVQGNQILLAGSNNIYSYQVHSCE